MGCKTQWNRHSCSMVGTQDSSSTLRPNLYYMGCKTQWNYDIYIHIHAWYRNTWNVRYSVRSNRSHTATSPKWCACLPCQQHHQMLRLPRKSKYGWWYKSHEASSTMAEDSKIIQEWFENDPHMNWSSRARPFAEATFRTLGTHNASCMEKQTFSRSGYLPRFSDMYEKCHGRQHHQMPHLPRKVTVRDLWHTSWSLAVLIYIGGRFQHDLIREWSEHELVISRLPLRRGCFSHWNRILQWELQHFALRLSAKISPNVLCLPRKVTLQHHQILRLWVLCEICDVRCDVCVMCHDVRCEMWCAVWCDVWWDVMCDVRCAVWCDVGCEMWDMMWDVMCHAV